MKKRLINIEVVEENDQRVVVTINADGEVKRMPVDPNKKSHAQATKALRKGVVRKTRPNAKETILIGKFDEGFFARTTSLMITRVGLVR